MLELYVQIACEQANTPSQADFSKWCRTALELAAPERLKQPLELTIRLVDNEESSTLNQTFRAKTGPTNILSFSSDQAEYLGDCAICAPLVAEEAAALNITEQAHWAHLSIHGVLHLLGFDHIDDEDAETMQALEIRALAKCGFDNPY